MRDKKLPHGTNRCQCAACGRYFGSVAAFDLHRTGPHKARNCATPSSLTDKYGRPKLRLSESGYWVRFYRVAA